jgi:hypothetical protein
MRARRLNSSMIDRIAFDDEAETLVVWFKASGKYVYHGVPRAIYDALAKAASAGAAFNTLVRGRFRGEPVGRRRYPLED